MFSVLTLQSGIINGTGDNTLLFQNLEEKLSASLQAISNADIREHFFDRITKFHSNFRNLTPTEKMIELMSPSILNLLASFVHKSFSDV